MNQQIIRKTNGQVIGRIVDQPSRIEARTSGGVLLGWYEKSTNRSRYANGVPFAFGNVISTLF